MNLIHKIRGAQIRHRLKAGPAWQNAGYVFTQQDGLEISPG